MLSRVIHTVPGLKENSGGVSRSVPGLCTALAGTGCKPILVSQRDRNARQLADMLPDPEVVPTRLIEGYDWPGLRMSFTPGLARALESICRDENALLMHDHGLWLHMNHVVAGVARRLKLRRIVSPRGMLDDWALKYRSWKKRAAWSFYQRLDLVTASAFSVTSIREVESLRALGLRQPAAVIPNGIELPGRVSTLVSEPEPRTVLFMSRIHPKKGLLDLVASWARVDRSGWRLVIAGPDEGGHRAEVEAAVARARLGASVTFTGPVEGAEKEALLSSARLFVLPSYSENFGIVVGEALAHGVPVITTNVTPWEELRSRDCGWWIDVGAAALEQALAEAMAVPADRRMEMGARGRELIAERYSWRTIALKHVELYEWLASGGARPGWLIA